MTWATLVDSYRQLRYQEEDLEHRAFEAGPADKDRSVDNENIRNIPEWHLDHVDVLDHIGKYSCLRHLEYSIFLKALKSILIRSSIFTNLVGTLVGDR